MKNSKKQNTDKGITLIALVITIIVLLILAMVSIKLITDGQLTTHANNAVTRYSEEQKRELILLGLADSKMSGSSQLNVEGATVTGDATNGWNITFDSGDSFFLKADGTITSGSGASTGGSQADSFDGFYYNIFAEEWTMEINGEDVSSEGESLKLNPNTKELVDFNNQDGGGNNISWGFLSKISVGSEELLVLEDEGEYDYFSKKQNISSEYTQTLEEVVYETSSETEEKKFTFKADGTYMINSKYEGLKYFIIDDKIFMEVGEYGFATISADKQTLTYNNKTYTKQ